MVQFFAGMAVGGIIGTMIISIMQITKETKDEMSQDKDMKE